jgi:uncharacterized cupredoxin-like copper-binding protein
MPRIRLTVLLLVIAALATACAGAGAASSPQTSTAAPTSAQPSVAPTAAAIASTAPASASPAIAPTVDLTEWSVTVAGTIKAGKTRITSTNTGVAQHELLVFKSDLDPSAYPVDAAGNIKEEGAGVKLVSDGANIDPAGTQVRLLNLAPGKYLFLCNIPGHFKAGMFTVVTVVA